MKPKTRILLVDDEAKFLFSAGLVLRKEGYRIDMADNGEGALALILEAERGPQPFRLLITDLRMPGMSGLGLIDAVRERDIFLPVLAITGFGDGRLKGELLAKGCSDCIEKPFEPDVFVKRVRSILGRDAFRVGSA